MKRLLFFFIIVFIFLYLYEIMISLSAIPTIAMAVTPAGRHTISIVPAPGRLLAGAVLVEPLSAGYGFSTAPAVPLERKCGKSSEQPKDLSNGRFCKNGCG